MSNVSSRRFSALLAAVAVAVLAMLGLARPATAASPGLPDPSKTANLHITKEATPGTTVGNGTQQDPGNPPIAGVTFTIKQVNTIDLTTQAGWNAADALSTTYNTAAPNNPGDAETAVTGAGYTLGAGSSQTTDAAGKVDFTNLPLGLYLVEETNAPAGVTPSAPFLVTLPLTDPDNLNAWMYDVYVYPKNAITGITKTVDDGDAVKIGDPVVWTINGDIPASTGPGDTVTGYEIKDALDTKLTYDPANPATATLSNGTALVAGTDYNVTFNAGTNTVKVLFTPAGLTKLTANRSAQVVVTIPTVVNAVGVIENVATLFPNQSAIDSDTGVDSPPVDTKWGSITFEKIDPNGNDLSGAVFKVYPTLADAQNDTNAIVINGTSTWTTGANGQITIDGLRYSDYANGHTVAPGDPGYQDYYLAEVTAPSGFELLAQPIKFDVTAQTSTIGIDMTITDSPSNGGFHLPFTGGTGESLVYLTGILLFSGAILIAFSRRRVSN